MDSLLRSTVCVVATGGAAATGPPRATNPNTNTATPRALASLIKWTLVRFRFPHLVGRRTSGQVVETSRLNGYCALGRLRSIVRGLHGRPFASLDCRTCAGSGIRIKPFFVDGQRMNARVAVMLVPGFAPMRALSTSLVRTAAHGFSLGCRATFRAMSSASAIRRAPAAGTMRKVAQAV